jgi:hypothetical protein
MFTKKWVKSTTERMIVTAAQCALTVVGVDQFSVWTADWRFIGGAALGGALTSFFKAVVASGTGDPEDAGLFQ